jgi:hypothetical protein
VTDTVTESVAGDDQAEASPESAAVEQKLVEQARSKGLQLTGEGGLLQQLTKTVLESALEGEITDHLGYDKHDPAGKNGGNSRNGTRSKTVLTDIGPVEIDVPCDREGSFEPASAGEVHTRFEAAGAGIGAEAHRASPRPYSLVPPETVKRSRCLRDSSDGLPCLVWKTTRVWLSAPAMASFS